MRLTKPNEHEAVDDHRSPVRDAESAAQAGRWFLDRGVRTAVITLGERGAVLVEADAVTELPAYRVEAVDTTAAGDAFTGALGAALSQGRPLPRRCAAAWPPRPWPSPYAGPAPACPTAAAVDEFLRSRDRG